jgi:hypothetical protein
MSIVFQFFLIALVLFSLLMVIGVPVAYASPKTGKIETPSLCGFGNLGDFSRCRRYFKLFSDLVFIRS